MGYTEEWKPVVGYEDYYEVSNYGRVKSVGRNIQRTNRYGTHVFAVSERILKTAVTGKCYLSVVLFRNGKGNNFRVHKLVLNSFVGPRPPGYECCHRDRNPDNNHLENIRWDTRQANMADRKRHGTDNAGERHGLSKLTEAQVLEIYRLRKETGLSQHKIGERFSVRQETICLILQGKSWNHLYEKYWRR